MTARPVDQPGDPVALQGMSRAMPTENSHIREDEMRAEQQHHRNVVRRHRPTSPALVASQPSGGGANFDVYRPRRAGPLVSLIFICEVAPDEAELRELISAEPEREVVIATTHPVSPSLLAAESRMRVIVAAAGTRAEELRRVAAQLATGDILVFRDGTTMRRHVRTSGSESQPETTLRLYQPASPASHPSHDVAAEG